MLILEGLIDYKHKPVVIGRGTLKKPDEYAPRFDELLDEGCGWINLNAAGVVGGVLLVSVELPGYRGDFARDKTSVNLSGPAVIGGAAMWDMSRVITIVG